MKILQPSEAEKLSKEEISELYRKLYSLYIRTRNSMAKSALEAAKEQIRVETLEQQRRELREIASFLRGETDFRDISLGAKLTMRYLISVRYEWSVIGRAQKSFDMVLDLINAGILLKEDFPDDLETIKLFLLEGKAEHPYWAPWEDFVLMRDDLTYKQKAGLTGRTVRAIKRRIRKLKMFE